MKIFDMMNYNNHICQYDRDYMNIAMVWSQFSYCKKKK